MRYLPAVAVAMVAACSADPTTSDSPDLRIPVGNHCENSRQDADESDVDCGGFDCRACADGLRCVTDSDCAGASCSGGVCTAASCKDGGKNGKETDADCGGPICAPCPDGKVCLLPTDCQSNACTDGLCASVGPSCQDGSENGSETDVDCGGGTCPACADGKKCKLAADCTSNECTAGTCTRPSPGSIAFAAPVTINTPGKPGYFDWADVSGDGKNDLVMLDWVLPFTAVPYLGDGKGGFQPKAAVGSMKEPLLPLLVDWNNDKRPDLLLSSPTLLYFYRGNGDGTFAEDSSFSIGAGSRFTKADVNGDSRPDLLYSLPKPGQFDVAVLLNHADGSLQNDQLLRTNCALHGPPLVADFTGSRRGDLVVTCGTQNGLSDWAMLIGHGDGKFDPGVVSKLGKLYGVAGAADLTGDGKVDLAFLGENELTIAAGNGNGTFQVPSVVPLANGPFSLMALADFNRDGRTDVAVAGQFVNRVTILPNTKQGLGAPVTVPCPNNTQAQLSAVDVNGDGKPDLVMSSTQPMSFSVWVNASN